MSKWLFRFRALDTFFFRDGTPFHAEEPGVTPHGVFPPSIFTLQGAIRAALAYYIKEWVPGKKWPEELGKVETEGLPEEEKRKKWGEPDDLGCLRLSGPYLQVDGKRYFPAPLLLIGRKEDPEDNECSNHGKMEKYRELTRLKPTESCYTSDLGRELRFLEPEKKIPDSKLIAGWLDSEGMEAVLNGKVPDPQSVLIPGDKWKSERRVGIMRDINKRTAMDHHLYTITHIRPEQDVELVVEVSMNKDWQPLGKIMNPLGGEGRFAEVMVEEAGQNTDFPKMPAAEQFVDQDGKLRFTVSLLTPARYLDMKKAVLEGPPEIQKVLESEKNERCVSASVGKAIQVGGWNVAARWPRTLQSFLPVGSTWFYEASMDKLPELAKLHGTLTGKCKYKAYGMGQIMIGTWKQGGK
ncbi:MAG: type III-B CRISPR module-associated Cmr3 family protein [Thermoactinomyces sp.]